MSAQQNETDTASRKRSFEMSESGGITDEQNRPPQEPRLMNGGHHLMGQYLQNMNSQQGSTALYGQALAQPNVHNGPAQMPALPPLPAAPVAAPAPQPVSLPINNMMMHPQQSQQFPAGAAAGQQQAVMADLVRQALVQAQANVQQIQAPQGPAPAAFPFPNAAPVQAQTSQAPTNFPVNHMVYTNHNQNPVATPQPAVQAQQSVPGSAPAAQFNPFGMQPQELLNYAVMVNILHNSNARGDPNALSNLLLVRQPQVANQQHMNQAMQPMEQGAFQGAQGSVGNQAPAPPSLQSNQMSSHGFGMNQNGDTSEHAVSPSIPSESNFNSAGSITGPVVLPNHVIEAQKIDPKIRCVPLWTNQDKSRLSTQQCWLRKQIETFPASQRDVRRHTRGRNRILKLGQVGIQCIHCKNLPQEGRGKGSSYFLSSTKGIYQAAQNILAYHFKEDTCPIISQKLLQEMKDAASSGCPRHLAPKAGKSRTGGGKQFWEESAVFVTGLTDTTVGIRYSDDRQNYLPLESVTLDSTESILTDGVSYCASESVLVAREDKKTVTDFCFVLMSQFVPYENDNRKSVAEMIDRDSDLEDEEESRRVGVVCRFCKGVSFEGKHRDGVFLSIKPSTMMRNKQLSKLHNHLAACRYVPDELKRTIATAKEMHLPQSDQLKRGWKKVFFENVSTRLKSALDAAGNSSGGEMSALSGTTDVMV